MLLLQSLMHADSYSFSSVTAAAQSQLQAATLTTGIPAPLGKVIEHEKGEGQRSCQCHSTSYPSSAVTPLTAVQVFQGEPCRGFAVRSKQVKSAIVPDLASALLLRWSGSWQPPRTRR